MKRFLILFLLFATRAFSQAVPATYPYPTLLPTSGAMSGGVLVTGPLRPSNYADNRAVVWDDLVGGGFRSVQSIAERDSIINGRRKEGMWVFVSASSGDAGAGHIYALAADLVTWYDLGAAVTGSLANADTSIYKDNGILEENRTLSGTNTYSLEFIEIPNYTISAGNLVQATSPNIYLDGTTSIEFNRSVSPLIFKRTPTAINNTEYITVKDPATGEFKTSTTTIASLQAGVSASGNIYTTNGTLSGNRTLSGGGFDLTMQSMRNFATTGTGNTTLTAYTNLTTLALNANSVLGSVSAQVAAPDVYINPSNNPYQFKQTPTTAASGDYLLFRNSAGEVRYDSSVTKASLGASTTLYSANGSLASARTVDGAGYSLTFTNVNTSRQYATNWWVNGSTIASIEAPITLLSGTTFLQAATPGINSLATTVKPGQYLQLQDTTGSLEYAPIYYTSTTSGQTGSTYTFSNAQMAPDFVQTYDHPVGTVAYLMFNAASVGADAIKLGPSTTTLGIVHHDGSVIAAGELLADVPYTFVKVGTGGSAKWLLQGHTSATTYTPLLNRVATVATVADLVALDPIRFQSASTKGYYAAADGGAGTYYWVSNQTSTNKGAKIASASSGSWVLLADEFNVKQWGAKGDGSTDDSVAINAAITYAGTQGINRSVYIPRGEFRIGSPIYIRGSDIKLRVHGHVKNINGTNTAVLIAGAVYDTGTAARITNGIAYYDTSNVSIDGEGIGILDQNGPNATTWDPSTTADDDEWHTLIAQTIKGLHIKNITVTNSIIWGMAVELCKEVNVSGNRVYNGRHSGRQVSGVFVGGTQDGIHLHDCIDGVVSGNYVESQDDTLAIIAYRSHSRDITVANNVGRVLTRYYLADGVTPNTNTLAGRFFLSAGIFGQTADVSLTNVVFSANVCDGGQGMFYIFDEDGDVAHAGTTQGIKLIGNTFRGIVDEASGTNNTRESWIILGAKDVDIVNNSFINIARVGRAVDYLSPTPGFIRFAGNHFENWQIAPDSQSLYANQPESILWFSDGTDIVIENNTFVNNQINPIYIGNNGGESTTNQFNSVTIRGNVFKNNMKRWSSTPTTLSSVATVYGANHVVFSDNVLDSNKGRGATVRSYKTLQANNNKITAHSSGYTSYGEAFYLIAAANDSAMTTTLQGNSVDTIDGYFAYFQNPGFTTVQNNVIRNSNVGYGSDQAMFMYLSGTAMSDLPYANFGGVFSGNQIFDATAKIPLYIGGTTSTASYTGKKLAYLDTQNAGGEVAVAPNGAGIIDFSQGYVVVTGNYTLKTYQQYAKVTAAATVTLPDATLCYGKEFTIKRLTSGAVTLATTSSQTFNGGAITQIVGDTLTVKSDGANWFSRVETIYTPLQLPDADFTYTVGSSANYYTESSITANRVVTLSTTGAYAGARVVFDRSDWTSVYTLTVSSIPIYGGDHIEFVFYNGSWFPEVIRKYARNDVTIVSTDSSTTFYPATSVKQLLYTGVITTDRTITLGTAGAQEGSVVRVTRTATSTGAFNLTVGTKALTVGTWADFVYDTGTAAWHLAAAGSL